jgi:formyltetrahydrofolate deformylase
VSAKNNAVLILSCPDKEGIVATLTQFLYQNGGNIVDANQHTDTENRYFFIRLEWELERFKLDRQQTAEELSKIADNFQMDWQIFYGDASVNIALFVSQQTHCLHDILSRYDEGDLPCSIPVIISNHEDVRRVAEKFEIAFECFPDPGNSEEKILEALHSHQIETLVLARYMQILGLKYLEHFKNQIINIHHSFLPAFAGGSPYKQAFDRGVKIIGATSHYATEKLDEGPIIAQDVIPINHRDSVEDLVHKGKDLEKVVLARAVKLHLERRILTTHNKTVIFE